MLPHPIHDLLLSVQDFTHTRSYSFTKRHADFVRKIVILISKTQPSIYKHYRLYFSDIWTTVKIRWTLAFHSPLWISFFCILSVATSNSSRVFSNALPFGHKDRIVVRRKQVSRNFTSSWRPCAICE
ncbi:hypothetical protein Mp_1g15140 [Marchantia polymorpha subsp. ruderalis]|uniref:Uncharacterized protein n=2 Tax=Marchantia polymorpha TaxID=3197 RepID=A0AAF6AQD0_MARPO|nr:hypothetical protein MARPO_0033s0147 [Marchantia polymorpha]BBM98650.1 hypothetical protein Mp_1g15140 [Marchantia polymorpha subsp. ruderalis]|eukprot:PTQ41759.1 hypothetical protein MARPO_0033s0147 [Marchantia polymorpha]